MADEYKYWAFISYSHRDKSWGDWLHKALETYRTPARLQGRPSRDGAVPKRLYPVFRDRDELPSSASLSENIDQALKASRYLIVICSPRAAVSRWVDGEIRQFKKLGREDRVLALVVDGEPNATDRPGSGELECFPPAMRYTVDTDGELTPARTEPIAADARPEGDGKANACLKILAGLLGVAYDELKQREKQRRFWRRLQATAAGVALLTLLAGGWMWVTQQKNREALVAQDTAQGRQLFIDGKPLQASVYLSEAYRLGGRSSSLRFLLARSMRYVDALKSTLPVPGLYVATDLSENGHRLVTAGGIETADVWDPKDGRHLATLRGTGAMLIGARLSPDGRYVAGASKPETLSRAVTVHVWDTETGKLLYNLPFPDSMIVRASFDRTGTRFLTRDPRHELVQAWDTATGKELFRLPATPGKFEAAAFSSDGRYVVTTMRDFSVHIFDGRDGHAEHVLRGHTGDVTDFEFSNDHKLMATASKDKTVQVWELATGKLVTKIARKNPDDYEGGHEDEVNAAVFTPDGKRLITASKDKTARVWDVATGKLVDDLARMEDEVGGISISDDGRYVTVNGKDSVWLYDLSDYTLRATLKANGAGFLPDGKTLLTVNTPDAQVQLWDLAALAATRSVDGALPVFSPDESHMLTQHYDVVNLLDGSGKLLKAIQLPPDPNHPEDKTYAQGVVWSPDGTHFAVDHADPANVSGLWDATGRPLGRLSHGIHQVEMPAFTPDGRYIYTCGQDVAFKPAKGEEDSRQGGNVGQLWEVAGVKLQMSFPMLDGCVMMPRFDASGRYMLGTVQEDRNGGNELYYHAELWDLSSGKLIAKLPGHLGSYQNAVTMSPTPGEALTATEDGIVHVWDMATGVEKRHWDTHGSEVEVVLYRPDGKALATGHRDGTLKVWDTASGALRWQIKGEQLGLNTVTYSPDGAFMLLNGFQSAPRIIDAADGALLMELRGDSHLVDGVEFSPRGGRVSTSAADTESSQIWDTHLEQREPEAVNALVRCRVPWKLQSGQLVPALPGC